MCARRDAHLCCWQSSSGKFSHANVCVLDLVASLFFCCGEKTDPNEAEIAIMVADRRAFSRNGVEVLSSPRDGFWSALGNNTIMDAR